MLEFGDSPSSACSSRETCIHFGERRTVSLNSETSCSGLNIQTYLSDDTSYPLFNWTCSVDANGHVNFYSTGFLDSKGIRDTIDWSASPLAFHDLKVVVTSSTRSYKSEASKWWTTPLVEISNGTTQVLSPVSGTLYLKSSTWSTMESEVFRANNPRVGLVLKAGAEIISGNSGALILNITKNHTWFEGRIKVSNSSQPFWVTGTAASPVNFTVARNSTIYSLHASGSNLIKLTYSNYGKFTNLVLDSSAMTAGTQVPLMFFGSSFNYLNGLTIGTRAGVHSVSLDTEGSTLSRRNYFGNFSFTPSHIYFVQSAAHPGDANMYHEFNGTLATITGSNAPTASSVLSGDICDLAGYTKKIVASTDLIACANDP